MSETNCPYCNAPWVDNDARFECGTFPITEDGQQTIAQTVGCMDAARTKVRVVRSTARDEALELLTGLAERVANRWQCDHPGLHSLDCRRCDARGTLETVKRLLKP